jgi:drug/metabolite transporter (DMT)-like permease
MGARAHGPHHDLPRGAAYMVSCAFLFAVMGVAVRLSSQQLPNAMVVFLRSALGLVILLPWALRLGPRGLGTKHLTEHLVRGLAGLAAMYCFFYALGHLRLADAMLLNYSLPLFVPFIESLWLGEPFPRRLWGGIVIGFLGLLLILKPGLSIFQPAAVVGVASGLLAALAQVGVRRLTQSEPVTRIVLYFGICSTLVATLPAALEWRTPRAALIPVLLVLGFSATLAQLLMTRAYAHAPASQVGPFLYSSVVFAGLFDWALFQQLPDRLSLAGAVLVCAAGIVTLKVAGAARSEPEPAGI